MYTAILQLADVTFGTPDAQTFANTKVTAVNATVTMPYQYGGKAFTFIPANQGLGTPAGVSVKLPKGCTHEMIRITFHLPNPRYTLLGIVAAVDKATTNRADTNVGRREFPEVTISRDDHGSQLTVTDRFTKLADATTAQKWLFGLVIQDSVDGSFGIHDPAIVNDPEENVG